MSDTITLPSGKEIEIPSYVADAFEQGDRAFAKQYLISQGKATEEDFGGQHIQEQSKPQMSQEEIQQGMQLGLALGENGEWVDPTTYAGQMFQPVSNKRVTYNKRHGLKQVDPIQDLKVGPNIIDNKLMMVELSANGNKKVRTLQKHEADAYGYKLPGVEEGNKSPAQQYLTTIADNGVDAVPDYMVGKGNKLIGETLANKFRDMYSTFQDNPEYRQFYAFTQLVNGEGMIKGIEQARAAGASGINTKAEFDMFKQGAPQLDMNSGKENLVSSVKRLKDYITYWNQQNQRKLEGTPIYDNDYNKIGEFKVEQPAKKEPAKDTSTVGTHKVPEVTTKTQWKISSNGYKYTIE